MVDYFEAIILREREGKAGGGKGALISDISFTLSTSNFQTLFVLEKELKERTTSMIIQNETLAFHHKQTPISGDVSPALGTTSDGMGIMKSQSVRRLTPRECERLQGFPDDWTAEQADSVRYRQMGNAVAVPVVEWIIKRIMNG